MLTQSSGRSRGQAETRRLPRAQSTHLQCGSFTSTHRGVRDSYPGPHHSKDIAWRTERPGLLRTMAAKRNRDAPPAAASGRTAQRQGGDRMNEAEIRAWLRTRIATAARISSADVDENLDFAAFGIDSVRTAELVGDLEQALGSSVDIGTLYANPCIRLLSAALISSADVRQYERPDDRPALPDTLDDIAVVGAACRFP